MPGLNDYRHFLADLHAELSRIEKHLADSGAPGAPCRPGCTDCCQPITVLPIEAHAIITSAARAALRGLSPSGRLGACGFLDADGKCAIYEFRPFLCRTRGFPILYLNGDGEWERDACAKRRFPPVSPGSPGLRLETWNSRLFHLNGAFCDARGIPPVRCDLNALSAGYAAGPSPA